MPEVVISGPEGRLEARYHHSKQENAPIALMLHPHPQHGGTMNNKVVYTLYQAFVKHGFSTLRFNFRGVGKSQGIFDRGEGELSDAAAALDWLQGYNANSTACWIAGFSFGAWIGMQLLMRRPEIDSFIAVAPPADAFDFAFLAPCPASGLIIQGDSDQLVSPDAVQRLATKLARQRDIRVAYEVIAGADHFFHNHQTALASAVERYLEGPHKTREAVAAR
ncbi:MAG TPA: alpha/beta hydrolase [Stellaceae bacterium]|nr:alpha/beta hydrolase [Stellaceae bacterium]